VFRGAVIRNHNHLLGNVPGVDGMKTGYIRASGFNIITSVRRGNRHIIAVVFGGRTARARDARVISLIDNNINVASSKRTAPLVAEGWATAPVRGKGKPAVEQAAVVMPAPARDPREPIEAATTARPALGSTAPITPNPVKTFIVHPGTMRTASLEPAQSRKLAPEPAAANRVNVTNIVTVKSEVPPPGARPGILGVLPAKVASASDNVPITVPEPGAKSRSGWIIQIGAFDDEKEAKHHLVAAQSKAKSLLGKADPFTERVNKGEKSLYRARFAGLDKEQAETACKHLKRSDIPCMMLKN
jgi:D-alanyl-D-alanine carboxypeptidase